MNRVNKRIVKWLFPFAWLCLIWGILAKGDMASWVVGLPTVVLALIAFDHLRSRRRQGIRAWRVPGFVVWFLWHSLRGGLDVARRALHPRMSLNPGFLRYGLSLSPGPARMFLINCVSLLPGTLSADIQGDDLVLHALDTQADVIGETRRAEQQVQRLYGISEGSSHG